MTLYNFSDINVVFDFEYKLKARIWNDDIEGVASMLTSAYNTVNPEKYSSHRCWGVLSNAVRYLQQKGWTMFIKFSYEGMSGKQFYAQSPDGTFYRSYYDE